MTDKPTTSKAPTPDTAGWWWITAEEQDADFLKGLGIVLGPYSDGCFYECHIPQAAFDLLDPLWGRFYWGTDT